MCGMDENLETSMELSEFLKLRSVLKFTTSLGKKSTNVDNCRSKQMSPTTTTLLLHKLKPVAACSKLRKLRSKAAWRSGNGVGRINEVTLRRARLVLGWVTCLGSTSGGGTLFRYVTSQPGQLSLSSFRGR